MKGQHAAVGILHVAERGARRMERARRVSSVREVPSWCVSVCAYPMRKVDALVPEREIHVSLNETSRSAGARARARGNHCLTWKARAPIGSEVNNANGGGR